MNVPRVFSWSPPPPPFFPGNTQKRPLRSEVEVEAGREEEDGDAGAARGAVAVRGEEG